MGSRKSENFFSARALAGGFTLAGFLVCLFASQAPKWWKEISFSRSTLVRARHEWVWQHTTVCSAEGAIFVTTQTTHYAGGLPGGLVVRSWHGELNSPGYATGGKPVPFPNNLWVESSAWGSGRWYNIMLVGQSGSSLRLPWWPFIALFGAWPAARVFRWARARRLVNAGACPGCGYDLRCTPNRCPECGRARPLPTPDMSPVV
jgi:hypothetical protein